MKVDHAMGIAREHGEAMNYFDAGNKGKGYESVTKAGVSVTGAVAAGLAYGATYGAIGGPVGVAAGVAVGLTIGIGVAILNSFDWGW